MKTELRHYISSDDILWVNPNKKETSDWLTLNRLQLPVGVKPTGLIRRITYSNGKAKPENSQHKTPMEIALEKAGAVDEFGNTKYSRRDQFARDLKREYKFYVDETLKSEMVYEYGSWGILRKESGFKLDSFFIT